DPEYRVAGAGARETSMQVHREMFGYFMRLVGERRRERREDLVSVLVDADVDGEALTEEEILYFAFLLIIAGNETTRNAVSGGMLALLEHPEQRDRLLADPSLIGAGIEELLRYLPDLALAGPVERLHSTLLRGIKRMPVTFAPEAG